MSLAKVMVDDAAVGVAFADRPEDLRRFLAPDCAAAIWRRQSDPGFLKWVAALAPEKLPDGRVVLRPEAVTSTVAQLCAIAGTPAGHAQDQLVEDIAALARLFTDLMRAPYLRLRLQPVTSNACRRFHIDAITARLVCTYRGTGTQYGISTDRQDPERVFTVPTGAPILLRGTLWPEKPASGLLHRSPPIEGTGETRLVLVVDAIHDPEEAV